MTLVALLLPIRFGAPENDTQFINKRSVLWKTAKPSGVLVVSDLCSRALVTTKPASALCVEWV